MAWPFFPVAASVTFRWTATIAALPEAPVSHFVAASVPNAFIDTDPTNNTAIDGPGVRGIFRNGFD